MTTSSFDEECTRFRQFLSAHGYPDQIIWVTPEDVLIAGARRFYVKLPVPAKNLEHARELFETAVKQQSGVSFSTVCEIHDSTCCNVWVPSDDDERQRAMCSKTALKMSVATASSRATGREIRNRFLWWYLGLRHRKEQARKVNYFWG
jgi:hypothetical protein